ncbi:phosphotransferase [bacterium]|nr:phosphotransferase [bacterium]
MTSGSEDASDPQLIPQGAPAAILDVGQLALMTSGDAALAIEVIAIFRGQADAWGRLLDASLDVESWGDAAHSIKGAARAVGAMALGEAALVAEQTARSGAPSAAAAAVAVGAVKDRMIEAIEAIAVLEHDLTMGRGPALGFNG